MRDIERSRKRIWPGVLAVVALAVALAGPRLAEQGMRLLYPRKYAEVVSRESEEFGLPEELVYAVIRSESGFDHNACSRAGARGLMQLTEETFRWISEDHPPENGGADMYDPGDNVHCGCALLRRLLDHYGELRVALAAYNAGMGNVDKWLEGEHSADGRTLSSIPFPETEAYVEKVERSQEIYRRIYGDER